MANQIPFAEGSGASGGYLIPDAQASILTTGLLRETGSLNLAGDKRATSSKRENFPIWLGTPTAEFVGEGAPKPVTGGELGQGVLNVKKVASIVLFTDEQKEDVRGGDLDVLVDSGVRTAISDVIDENVIGKADGTNISTNFDTMLRSTTSTVEIGATGDKLRLAVSEAMGILESNGYQDHSKYGILLASDVRRHIRDARAAVETTTAIYDATDPLYGIAEEYSTNLSSFTASAGATKFVGFLVHKPNLHVRIRKDVNVAVSSEATINDGSTDRHLFQENLTALRYECRLGFLVHDLNRAVVAIKDAS